MLLPKDRGFVHPIASEITPQAVFNTRRRWLAAISAMAALGPRVAWPQANAAAKGAALPGARSAVPGAITMEKPTRVGRRHQLQQLLRVRHRQERPGAACAHAEDAAVDREHRG